MTRRDDARNLPSFSDHYDTTEETKRSDARFHNVLEADIQRILRKRKR